MYIDQCNSNGGTGLGRCGLGIWKLRGVEEDTENVGTPHLTKMKIWFIYYKNIMRHRNICNNGYKWKQCL